MSPITYIYILADSHSFNFLYPLDSYIFLNHCNYSYTYDTNDVKYHEYSKVIHFKNLININYFSTYKYNCT